MNRALCPLAIKSICRDESFCTICWSLPFLGTSNTFPSLTEKQEFGMALCEKNPLSLRHADCIKWNVVRIWRNADVHCATEHFLSVKYSIISELPKVSCSQVLSRMALPVLVELSNGIWAFFLTPLPRFKELYHILLNSNSKRIIILLQTEAGKTRHSRTWKPQIMWGAWKIWC